MLIAGRCHCGNVSFTLDWQPEPLEIPARACACSFCTKHGNVWTSCPTGALQVRVADESLVSRYSFETRTAEFHVCARCGVTPVVTSRIDGDLYAVVNVHTIEGAAAALVRPATTVSFDGETEEARLARRKKGWIAKVEMVSRLEGR